MIKRYLLIAKKEDERKNEIFFEMNSAERRQLVYIHSGYKTQILPLSIDLARHEIEEHYQDEIEKEDILSDFLYQLKDYYDVPEDDFKNIEEDIDVCEDTIYRIASISKVIVALGAMKLVEEGKLDIYEDVSKYLGYTLRNPNHPDKKITLEQIMTQSSSITDGFDDPDKGYDAVNGPSVYVPLKEILTNPDYEYYNPKTFLNAEPGEQWLYSNFGCGILACIIEKVSGKLFTDYIKEVLLDPLEIDGGFRV